MTVIVIMCDGTCVKKSFKKKAKAEEFASKCRKSPKMPKMRAASEPDPLVPYSQEWLDRKYSESA